ncbi:alpha/beta hydrolase [Gracilibacillus halophilus YIM-C55.5]|uniref:Alpha/beta hydrolase n=1 Tax=Gracilibacillus halophilus YIM-C55.5 TaxID=1308866 RepID=N4WD15_9BACI|nr:alpha/beta fold hydrolase [Gracilibacillus halophilus]ENH97119.1 alpha/beta hydrolase [Gracilibacillus halophilus YIM-C55.5]
MYIDVNQRTYWVETFGQGDPVLFLHGFTGSTKTWHFLLDQQPKDVQFIFIDLPGHGQTKISQPVSIKECCRDIASILQKLMISSVHVIGYSMGGRVALSFASWFPSWTRSLILESASPGIESVEERKHRAQQDQSLADFIRQHTLVEFVDYWENIPLFQSQKQLPIDVQSEIRDERLCQHAEGLALSLEGMGLALCLLCGTIYVS